MAVKFRKNIMPKNLADLSASLFLTGAMITVYWFELFIVMPTLFTWKLYLFHIVLGTFVLSNILGNFAAIIVVDSSTKEMVLPAQVPPGWHVCAECESVAPPRSRHCNTCRACILKKEHHCIFTGCCVGLYNHRYFYVFLTYMWAATLYCSILNASFIWPYVGGVNSYAAVRLLIPGIWLILYPSLETLYAFLFTLNLIGCLFLSILFYYYTSLMLRNVTTHETNSKTINPMYNLGSVNNCRVVLGERWFITWIFPTVNSRLPYDGVDWEMASNADARPKTK